MPWPSTHGSASWPPPAPTAAVLRSAISTLLMPRCCWSAMFRAGAFHFFTVLAIFVGGFSVFFVLPKRVFHLFQFVRIETLGFVFPSSLIVHVSIAHGFHELVSHGNHLLAGLAKNFLFQFLELSHIKFFFNHAARLHSTILFRNVLRIAAGRSP